MSKEAAMNLVNTPAPAAVVPDVTTQSTDSIDSRRMAIFAKREKQAQEEREKLKREKEDFNKEREQVGAVQKRAKDFDDLRAKDPIAALKMLGFTEADIFNYMAGTEKKEPTAEEIARAAAKEESQKLRDEIAASKASDDEKRNKELIDGLKSDIGKTLVEKADTYKFCAFRGPEAEAQVFDYIDQVLKDHKVLLSPEEAMKDIEELYQSEAKALTELMKPKEEVDPTKVEVKFQADRKREVEKPKESPAPVAKTLTNKISATASAVAQTSAKRETPQEKRARLEEALRRGHL